MNQYLIILIVFLSSSKLFALTCGEQLTQNTTLTQDLDCSGHSGFGLIIKDDFELNGNGHKIIIDSALAAIYVQDARAVIKNLEIVGTDQNIAIQGYNAKSFEIDSVIANNFRIGVDFTFDSSAPVINCEGVSLKNSELQNSKTFGLKISAPTCAGNIELFNNKFDDSQYYSMIVDTVNFHLNGNQGNTFNNSQNGFHINADYVDLKNLDFSEQNIQNETMLIFSSTSVKITDSNFSSTHNTGIGLHICDANYVELDGIVSNGHDVGIKIAVDTKQTQVKFNSNLMAQNQTAGLLLATLSGLPFQSFIAEFNVFNQNTHSILKLADILNEEINGSIENSNANEQYTVTCNLKVPDWLGLGRLTRRLQGDRLIEEISDNTNKNHYENGALTQLINFKGKRNFVRARMRKKIAKNVGIGKTISFTVHPIFTQGVREVIDGNYTYLNQDFKNAVAFALVSEYNSQIIPLLSKFDRQGKIKILSDELFAPLIDTEYLSLNEILYYNNEFFPGMDDAVTIVQNLNLPFSETNLLIQGDDGNSKRRLLVGGCNINELVD